MNSTGLCAAFAMDASLLLENGAANDAALLCVSGLGMYPDYLGGYVLLSRAYDALNRPLDARIILEEAERRFPSFVAPLPPSATLQPSAPLMPSASLPVPATDTPVVEPARSVPPRGATPSMTSPLRIIDTAQILDDTRIIRSASVRLIPGLEFTTLRFEGTKMRGRREIQTLSDPPPFRRFHPARRVLQPAQQQSRTSNPSSSQQNSGPKPVSLEELANRLERARMPRSGESASATVSASMPPHTIVPMSANQELPRQQMLVTETIARIYMQQGAYEKAIDAFTALAKSKPDKSEEYRRIIEELTSKLNS